ncbi:MAG TPA: GTP cyclohydrolase II [Stellaceae bacterium]|nr:GTP cyclohydrolase II [Stellaceae bacterium]
MLNRRSSVAARRHAPIALIEVDRAITDLRRGGLVVIRGPDASILVQAAEAITPDSFARFSMLAGGRPLLAITQHRAAALNLAEAPREPAGTMLLSLPAETDARFLRYLADPAELALIAKTRLAAKGVRPGEAAEAAVELAKLARLLPAALTARLGRRDAAALARREGLLSLAAADILGYEAAAAVSLRRVAEARVPLEGAEETQIVAFRPSDGGVEHLAILIGNPDPAVPVLTRLHSECFTGDLLGSLRCDCGEQLRGAIREIARAGGGVLLYMAQEGRGIGLVNKLRAYQLQDSGFDTVDANEQLGFDADERLYLPAAEMLRQLRFLRVRLLTNNPEKVAALNRCGIAVVERVPHVFPANGHNERYLRTKATRSGHLL